MRARRLHSIYSVDTLYPMADIRFEWDPRKDASNRRKHGVSFQEASSVFVDENALIIPDPTHSDDEDRFLLLGVSARMRALVVCHCLRNRGDTIRLISARKANRLERAQYEARRAK